MALDLAQMVLEVQKNPKPTKFYMLNNFCFNNFSKKSIPGDVRAQVLQEPVGASHADQGRKSGVPHLFSDPGGQAGSNGTPYGQSCLASSRGPGGGSCSNYNIDVNRSFHRIPHDIGDVSEEHEIRLGNWHHGRVATHGD